MLKYKNLEFKYKCHAFIKKTKINLMLFHKIHL